MILIGISTGAVARADFRSGVELARRERLVAVELSALRDVELEPLLQAIESLELEQFSHVSLHAPSKLELMSESQLVELLGTAPLEWPLIVHPDVIRTPQLWLGLGHRLCLENMDQRKPTARTAGELQHFFHLLPEATFCLDLGHARQVDPTMSVAISLLSNYGGRLRQIHVSEVNERSRHVTLNTTTIHAFRRVSPLIPATCPWIIESEVAGDKLAAEIAKVRECTTAERAGAERRFSLTY